MKKNRLLVFATIFFFLFTSAVKIFASFEAENITAYRLKESEIIKVDGKNNEEAWSKAVPCKRTRFLAREEMTKDANGRVPKPLSEKTDVRACYDAKNIYFYIRCFDEHSINPGVSSDGWASLREDSTAFYYAASDGTIYWFAVNPAGGKIFQAGGKRPDFEMVPFIFKKNGWGAEARFKITDLDYPAPDKEGVMRLSAGFDRKVFRTKEWADNNYIGQGENQHLMGKIIFSSLGKKALSFEELLSLSLIKKEGERADYHFSGSGFISKQGLDIGLTYDPEDSDILKDVRPLETAYNYWAPEEKRPAFNRRGIFTRLDRGIWGASLFQSTNIETSKGVADLVLKNKYFSFGSLTVLNKNGRNNVVSMGKTELLKFTLGGTHLYTHLYQRQTKSHVLAFDVKRKWETLAFYSILAKSKDGGRCSGNIAYFRGRLGADVSFYCQTNNYFSPLSHNPLAASYGLKPFIYQTIVFKDNPLMKKMRLKSLDLRASCNVFEYWNGQGPYQRVYWAGVATNTEKIFLWDYNGKFSVEKADVCWNPGEKNKDVKYSSGFGLGPSSDNSAYLAYQWGRQADCSFSFWGAGGCLKIKSFKLSSSFAQKRHKEKEGQAIISLEIGGEKGLGGAAMLVAVKTAKAKTLYSPTIVVRYIKKYVEGHVVFIRGRDQEGQQENEKIENKFVFKLVSKQLSPKVWGKIVRK